MSPVARLCSVEECLNPAREGDLCFAHARRRRRGSTMAVPVKRKPKDLIERILEAAIAYADADAEEGGDQKKYRQARHNLLRLMGHRVPR